MSEENEIPGEIIEPSIHAVSEGAIEMDQSDWREFMDDEELKEFKGSKSRAAYILEHLSTGVGETYAQFKKRGIDADPPGIGVNYKNDGMAIQYDSTNHLVVIGMEYLESFSDIKAINLSDLYEFKRSDGEVVFRGKLLEYVLSLADEEAHHSIYMKYKGKESGRTVNALDMSIAEYEAIPIEHRARRWVIQDAKRRNFSKTAIDFLEMRYKEANDFIGRGPIEAKKIEQN
jgi:hypothetical protein